MSAAGVELAHLMSVVMHPTSWPTKVVSDRVSERALQPNDFGQQHICLGGESSPVLVHLHQYSEADANDVVRSGTDVDPETDKQSYFNVDDLELDEWERMERDDDVVLRRMLTYENVTAVSAPQDTGSVPSSDELPGQTLQLRKGNSETGYVENAELVEAQDRAR